MRTPVVLDTNILLDVYVYQDPRTAALARAMDQEVLDLLACDQTLSELADVVTREKFRLAPDQQREILTRWNAVSRQIPQTDLLSAPWRCKDKADQVFLDMAWTHRPCLLISKDLAVLRFAKRAAKEGVLISAGFQWSDAAGGQQTQ